VSGALRVASWNVLAHAYAWPDLYARCDANAIDVDQRRVRVVDAVVALDADVVALQEADAELVAALRARFGDERIVAFVQKSARKLDGCAFVVDAALSEGSSVERFDYDDGTGHVAALLTIAARSPDGRRLVVANTHLKWERPDTPIEERLGLAQASHLLRRANAIVREEQASCIVCGDFNATADDAVLTSFTSAGFVDAYAALPNAFTAVANGRARRIDFILASADLRATPEATVPLADDDVLPSLTLPSDHAPIAVTLVEG
jgi:endonuclease/exonuclease/phosphatase family metal-dependent hydrolase